MKFKGNLHVHTNRSDGQLTPKECIDLYKSRGYDFLAVTDHFKFFEEAKEYSDESFTVLNGCEMNYDRTRPNKSTHIVCLEPKTAFTPERALTAEEGVRQMTDNGGLAIIAHPSWSLMSFEDCTELKGVAGIEIWNHISHSYTRRGHSGNYVDVCAASGMKPLLFAVDDAHFYDTDCFGGYIVVESPSNSREDLLKAIRKGNFYSSQGPDILQFERQGDKIYAKTSPVASMAFLSDALWARDRVQKGENGNLITEGVYTIKPQETFVRLECYDENEKTAWSQIIYV